MLVIEVVLVPTLLSVTVFPDVMVPIATVPKFRLEGVSFAVVPIPLRATFCGLPAALSETVKAADRRPAAPGLNLTEIVQLYPADKELPQE